MSDVSMSMFANKREYQKAMLAELIERLEDERTDGALFLRREAAAALRSAAEREARLVEAAKDVLSHREGDLPQKGWLWDTASSRAALGRLAEAIAAAKGETK